MKYFKRLGLYKASNVTFDPKTLEAYSYRWWKFVAVVEGKVVFNNYNYSISTSRHQRKVRQLLLELGIKIDISMPLPNGISTASLEDQIVEAEECLCNQWIKKTLRAQERYQEAKNRKHRIKLETYLDTVVHFRDYEIKPIHQFGTYNKIAVHQIVEDIEHDVNNALRSFSRDGFGNIVFYI